MELNYSKFGIGLFYFFLLGLNLLPFVVGGHASPYGFAADANTVVDNVESNFSCSGLEYGYYADQSHNCKVFHICMPITTPRGRVKDSLQFSFFCPNRTRFSQDSRTCISDHYAYPCEDAHKLYSLNSAFGDAGDSSVSRKTISDTNTRRTTSSRRPVTTKISSGSTTIGISGQNSGFANEDRSFTLSPQLTTKSGTSFDEQGVSEAESNFQSTGFQNDRPFHNGVQPQHLNIGTLQTPKIGLRNQDLQQNRQGNQIPIRVGTGRQRAQVTTGNDGFQVSIDADDDFSFTSNRPSQTTDAFVNSPIPSSKLPNEHPTIVNNNLQTIGLPLPGNTATSPPSFTGSDRAKEISDHSRNNFASSGTDRLEPNGRRESFQQGQLSVDFTENFVPSLNINDKQIQPSSIQANSGNSYLPTNGGRNVNQNFNLQLENVPSQLNRGPVNRNRGRRVNDGIKNSVSGTVAGPRGENRLSISPALDDFTEPPLTISTISASQQPTSSRSFTGRRRGSSRQGGAKHQSNQNIKSGTSAKVTNRKSQRPSNTGLGNSERKDDIRQLGSKNGRGRGRFTPLSEIQPISQKSLQNLFNKKGVNANAFAQFPQLNFLGGNVQQIGFRIIKHDKNKRKESNSPTVSRNANQVSRIGQQLPNKETGQTEVNQFKNDVGKFPSTSAVELETFKTKEARKVTEENLSVNTRGISLKTPSRGSLNEVSNSEKGRNFQQNQRKTKLSTFGGSLKIPGFSKGMIRRNGQIIEGTAKPRNHAEVTTSLLATVGPQSLGERATPGTEGSSNPFRRIVSRRPTIISQTSTHDSLSPRQPSTPNRISSVTKPQPVPANRSSRGRNRQISGQRNSNRGRGKLRQSSAPQDLGVGPQISQNSGAITRSKTGSNINPSKSRKRVNSSGHEIKTTRDFEQFIEEDIDAATASLLAGIQPPNVIRNKKDLALPERDGDNKVESIIPLKQPDIFSEPDYEKSGGGIAPVRTDIAEDNEEITEVQPRLTARQRLRTNQDDSNSIRETGNSNDVDKSIKQVNVRRRVVNRNSRRSRVSSNTNLSQDSLQNQQRNSRINSNFDSNFEAIDSADRPSKAPNSDEALFFRPDRIVSAISRGNFAVENRRQNHDAVELPLLERNDDKKEVSKTVLQQPDNSLEPENKKFGGTIASVDTDITQEDEEIVQVEPRLTARQRLGTNQDRTNSITITANSNDYVEPIKQVNVRKRIVNRNSRRSRVSSNTNLSQDSHQSEQRNLGINTNSDGKADASDSTFSTSKASNSNQAVTFDPDRTVSLISRSNLAIENRGQKKNTVKTLNSVQTGRLNRRNNRNLSNSGTVGSINTENINGEVHPELTTTTTTTTTTRRPRTTRTPRPTPPQTTPRPVNKNRGDVKFQPSQYIDWSWLNPTLRNQLNSLSHGRVSRIDNVASKPKSLQASSQPFQPRTPTLENVGRKKSFNNQRTLTDDIQESKISSKANKIASTQVSQGNSRRRVRNNHVKVRVSPLQQDLSVKQEKEKSSSQSLASKQNQKSVSLTGSPITTTLVSTNAPRTTVRPILSANILPAAENLDPVVNDLSKLDTKAKGTRKQENSVISFDPVQALSTKSQTNPSSKFTTGLITDVTSNHSTTTNPLITTEAPSPTTKSINVVDGDSVKTTVKLVELFKPTETSNTSTRRRRKRIRVNRRPVVQNELPSAEDLNTNLKLEDQIVSTSAKIESTSLLSKQAAAAPAEQVNELERQNVATKKEDEVQKPTVVSLRTSSRSRGRGTRRRVAVTRVEDVNLLSVAEPATSEAVDEESPGIRSSRRRIKIKQGRSSVANKQEDEIKSEAIDGVSSNQFSTTESPETTSISRAGRSRDANRSRSQTKTTTANTLENVELETEVPRLINSLNTGSIKKPSEDIAISRRGRGRIHSRRRSQVEVASRKEGNTDEQEHEISVGNKESESSHDELRTLSLRKSTTQNSIKLSGTEIKENALGQFSTTESPETTAISRAGRGRDTNRLGLRIETNTANAPENIELETEVTGLINSLNTGSIKEPSENLAISRRGRGRINSRRRSQVEVASQKEEDTEEQEREISVGNKDSEKSPDDELRTLSLRKSTAQNSVKLSGKGTKENTLSESSNAESKPKESQVRLRPQRRRQFSSVRRKVTPISTDTEEEKTVEKTPKKIVVSVLNNARGSRRRQNRRRNGNVNQSVAEAVAKPEEKLSGKKDENTRTAPIEQTQSTESPINSFIRVRSRSRTTPSPVTTTALVEHSSTVEEYSALSRRNIATRTRSRTNSDATLDLFDKFSSNLHEEDEIQRISESQNRRRTAVRRRLINSVSVDDKETEKEADKDISKVTSLEEAVTEPNLQLNKVKFIAEKSDSFNLEGLIAKTPTTATTTTTTESIPALTEKPNEATEIDTAKVNSNQETEQKIKPRSRTDFPIRRRGSRKLVKKVKLVKNEEEEKFLENVFETLRSGNKNRTISSSELALPGVKPGSKLRVVGTSVRKSVSTSASSGSEVGGPNASLLEGTLERRETSPISRPNGFVALDQELQGSEGAESAVVRTRVIKRKLSS